MLFATEARFPIGEAVEYWSRFPSAPKRRPRVFAMRRKDGPASGTRIGRDPGTLRVRARLNVFPPVFVRPTPDIAIGCARRKIGVHAAGRTAVKGVTT